MTITSVQDKVSKTAAFDGAGLDVSGFKDAAGVLTDWAFKFRLHSLTAGKKVRFEVQETTGADFTTHKVLESFSFEGGVKAPATVTIGFKKREKPLNYFGSTGGQIRVSLVEIDAGATAVYSSWLETA